MPTTRPRITMTLTTHSHEVLSRLSAASGDSMSQIVAGFVDLAVPSLERVCVVLERARVAPEEVRDGLRASIERAERDLIPGVVAALGQGDLFMARLAAEMEPQPSRLRPAQRGASSSVAGKKRVPTPVPVTRGSGGGKTLPSGVAAGSDRLYAGLKADGQRVLLKTGEHFDKSGVLRQRPKVRNRG